MIWQHDAAFPIWAALISFAVTIVAGPFTIGYLRRLKFGQNVREDGPRSHLKKSGTPSMGGVLILIGVVIGVVLTTDVTAHLPLALFAALGFGVIGFIDDLINILTRRSLGLRARHKLIAQFTVGLLVALYAVTNEQIGPNLLLPFTEETLALNPVVYVLFVVIVMIASANAVNITDGVDGLAAGSTAVAALAYGIISMVLGSWDMAIFSGAIVGACLGFSWFNAHPAQVFMGDTGSLGLGAAIAAIAVFTRTPLFLPIVGGLFALETLSVIIQVTYFRLSKGKRVFRMAPLHHHFELGGWEEPKVTVRFWLIGLFFAALGLLAVL